jgi:hypothetical protein
LLFFFLSCIIRISVLMLGHFQVLENDGLPANICTRCMIKVNVAYELRQQCQRSDMELRRLYGKTLKKYVVSNNVLIKVFLFMSKKKISYLKNNHSLPILSCRISTVKPSYFLLWIRLNQNITSN